MSTINENEWDKMLLKYKFAKTILEAELEILLKEYEYRAGNSPVEHIKSRLKSEKSILKKLEDKGYDKTVENVEKHIHDIVGFRIVCSFLSDVYDIVNIIKSSKNFKLKGENDYIKNPKETGYSSYHLNILVPIYLEEKLEYVEAEIQIRTVAMDFWASLDHKLQYKLPEDIPVYLERELLSCSDEIKIMDLKMQNLYDIVKKYTDKKQEDKK
ncbi:MAG: GTP pyrophosphokinase family protein [bacterium]|nr:GTP pyrophosphokinase family protein [Mycoplasmatota bacterium]MDD6756925.1 GTP pyrophosphokinase family protein [bacterium]MDY2908047.1 GTP pyrophosphokinase family protein [Candidatus Faecimonas sp.]